MENKIRQRRRIQYIVIALLALALVVSIMVVPTVAYFFSSATATGTITLGQAVDVEVEVIGDKDTKGVTLTMDKGDKLVPGCTVTLSSNVTVKQSTTSVYLRAVVTVDITAGETDTTAVENKILELIGENIGSEWLLFDGAFYYINGQTASAGDTIAVSIDTTTEDKSIALFNNTSISLGGELGGMLDNNYKNADLVVHVNYQAIQSLLAGNSENSVSTLADIMDAEF